MIRIVFIFFVALFASSPAESFYNTWVDSTYSYFHKSGLELQFTMVSKVADIRVEERWSFQIQDLNHFELRMGSKTVYANGEVWTTVDTSTMQAFISNPDLDLRSDFEYWLNAGSLKNFSANFGASSDEIILSYRDGTPFASLYFQDGNPNLMTLFSQDNNILLRDISITALKNKIAKPQINEDDFFLYDLRQ